VKRLAEDGVHVVLPISDGKDTVKLIARRGGGAP
jgi:hypothetical protein